MRTLIPLLMLAALVACKKDNNTFTQVTDVTTPTINKNQVHSFEPEQSFLYEVNYWWGSPSLYGQEFPMGTSVAAFNFDGPGATAPILQIELVAYSGYWWELGTDWVLLCVDSFTVHNPEGHDIELVGTAPHGMFTIVTDGPTITVKSVQDSSVFEINRVKVFAN